MGVPGEGDGGGGGGVVTYDGSSSSNDPIIYVDGSSQTVTEEVAPTGTIDNSNTSAYLLGNRDAFDRNWDGRLAEFAIWDRILPGRRWDWGSATRSRSSGRRRTSR